MRKRKSKRKPVSKEAARKKEREILRKENEATKKRIAAKKKKKGYAMTNPVQKQMDKRRDEIMTNRDRGYKRARRGKLA